MPPLTVLKAFQDGMGATLGGIAAANAAALMTHYCLYDLGPKAELGKFLTGKASRPEDTRLPPGQHLVKNWPILDLGQTPNVPKEVWRLDIVGLVDRPQTWTFANFMAQPQTHKISDIHCVTSWSRYDNHWEGVTTHDLLEPHEKED